MTVILKEYKVNPEDERPYGASLCVHHTHVNLRSHSHQASGAEVHSSVVFYRNISNVQATQREATVWSVSPRDQLLWSHHIPAFHRLPRTSEGQKPQRWRNFLRGDSPRIEQQGRGDLNGVSPIVTGIGTHGLRLVVLSGEAEEVCSY